MSKRGAYVSVDGLDNLMQVLDAYPREAARIGQRAVYKIGGQIRDDIRQATPVFSGNLKRSIKVKKPRNERGVIGAEVRADRSGGRSGKGYHFHLVEYGTVKMSARKFARPVVERYAAQLPSLLKAELLVQLDREIQRKAKRPVK